MKTRMLCLMVAVLSLGFSFQTAAAEEIFAHRFGHFEVLSTTRDVIIAAPHGTYDTRTGVVAKDVARMLGAGYIVARGFSPGRSRINVNRPTEGVGKTCERERRTERSQDVYEHYIHLINRSCGGHRLRLYVEIHGHTSLPFPKRLEIATTGFSVEEARQLKVQFPTFIAQAKAIYRAYPELDLRMEPLDKVFFGARCNKMIGYISTRNMDRALHIEIPRLVRTPEAMEATVLLVCSIVRTVMNYPDPISGPGGKEG